MKQKLKAIWKVLTAKQYVLATVDQQNEEEITIAVKSNNDGYNLLRNIESIVNNFIWYNDWE